MKLLDKTDKEIIEIANPIWNNLFKTSNAKDYGGWTAFMLACSNGHKDVIRLLLDRWTIQTELIDLNVRRSNIPQVSYPHI